MKTINQLVLLFVIATVSFSAQGQTYTTTASGTSSWGTGSNWSKTAGGNSSATPVVAPWWPTVATDVTVNRNMTLGGTQTFTAYFGTLLIDNGATLTLGNVTFDDNSGTSPITRVIVRNGKLTATSLTIKNGAQVIVEANGTLEVTQDVTINGGGNALLEIQTGGVAELDRDVIIDGSASNGLVNAGSLTVGRDYQIANGYTTSSGIFSVDRDFKNEGSSTTDFTGGDVLVGRDFLNTGNVKPR
ncbi:MAG: hypothetical protein HC842_04605 [Cytophagales bacterium]|nr:hypothetical protein [Cytophagales bacterium]